MLFTSWDLWKMVRTIILFLFRIISAWRRVTIEDDKVPLSPGWASNSGPTGEIFAYLTHLDIISPGVRYRLKAMLSRMFCVCVLARPRYRQRPLSYHRRMLTKVRSMTLRIGFMERLKRCSAWLKCRLRYALFMIQSRKWRMAKKAWFSSVAYPFPHRQVYQQEDPLLSTMGSTPSDCCDWPG